MRTPTTQFVLFLFSLFFKTNFSTFGFKGEAVSLAGTHLGHNLPDRKGNRYCINLVSVAGTPDSAN